VQRPSTGRESKRPGSHPRRRPSPTLPSTVAEPLLRGKRYLRAGVARFLAQFPAPERAQALHLALRALRARVEPDQVLMCELAWEVHRHGYRSQLCRDDGSPYDCEKTYFREVLGLSSWRTAYTR
jgi:hypothetical protein